MKTMSKNKFSRALGAGMGQGHDSLPSSSILEAYPHPPHPAKYPFSMG